MQRNGLETKKKFIQLYVLYEDNESYLSRLIGKPGTDGGFSWEAERLRMGDGKTFQVMKGSTISATFFDGDLHVFFVVPGGDIIHAFWFFGWHWKVVAGDI